jgi:hypothetical protein
LTKTTEKAGLFQLQVASGTPEIAKIPCIFPDDQGICRGEQFALDCVIQQAVVVKRDVSGLTKASAREIVRHSQMAFENVVREFGLKSNSGPRILSAPLNIGDNCFCPSEKIGIDDQAGG